MSKPPCDVPVWARSLNKNGLYYEGFVEDVESTMTRFQADTVTTFGTRKSRYSTGSAGKRSSSCKEISAGLTPSPSENDQNSRSVSMLAINTCNSWAALNTLSSAGVYD